jgi:ribosome-associated heat shock protein Hsp15
VSEEEKVRLDKWLWAARFFKTRSLATEAVQGGKVHVNGQRVKAAKEVHPGQVLTIRSGWSERTVVVKALSNRRGSAPVAQQLYEESAESLARREAEEEQRRLARQSGSQPADKRPNKKDRRLIHRFKRLEE